MDECRTRYLRLGFATLIAGGFLLSCWLVAQDPLPPTTAENPARTPSEIGEDPLLRTIKDRAQLIAPATATPVGDLPVQVGQQKSFDNHWRAAELMLRSARLLDRDADAADRQGQSEQGAALRAIAANLRANVVRLLAVHP